MVVFLVPMTIILLVLGGAYGWSAAQRIQQQVSSQLLGDLSYFATGARQALRAGDPAMIETELRRFGRLYDTQVEVFDRSGTRWASSTRDTALTETGAADIRLALSGRRGEPVAPVLPWSLGEIAIVEPVFDDGSVIGAVRIVASAEGPKQAILAQWSALIVVSAAIIAALVWSVFWLAAWVLKPLRRVDNAMAAIERGDMDARISGDTGPPEVRGMVRMFNQMAEEIERVMSRQQEFVMNASHELRNPLGALLLRVEYLATGLDEGWDTDVEHAREEGKRMTRILDTLLSVARAGKADSAFAMVDLADLIEGRVTAWEHRAREQGVALVAIGDAAQLSATDRTATESVLDAIIDNALKFAPSGSTVHVLVGEIGGDHVIAVRDRGRGLEPEQLELATSRFWRSPLDQNVPGSGLGLAIASDLMEALGGRIVLSSPPDGGLLVEMHLPVTASEPHTNSGRIGADGA